MNTPESRWISPRDAAQRLGISEQTLRRRIADGSVVAKRFGPRLLRVDPASLDFGRPVGGAA